jgi:hypothetical protein
MSSFRPGLRAAAGARLCFLSMMDLRTFRLADVAPGRDDSNRAGTAHP